MWIRFPVRLIDPYCYQLYGEKIPGTFSRRRSLAQVTRRTVHPVLYNDSFRPVILNLGYPYSRGYTKTSYISRNETKERLEP
jgi:hypothetical protein